MTNPSQQKHRYQPPPTGHQNKQQPKGSLSLEESVKKHLIDVGKGDGGKGGTYRRNAHREIHRFINWAKKECETENDEITFDDLYPGILRDYIRFLKDGHYKPSTVKTYYYMLSSWVSSCIVHKYIRDDYIIKHESAIPLPDNDQKDRDRQFWTKTNLDNITDYVDEIAGVKISTYQTEEVDIQDQPVVIEDAERSWYDVVKSLRNSALVYTIGYSGVRGSEIFRQPDDPRRDGLLWSDVNFEYQGMDVYRKRQAWDVAPLPDPAFETIKQYQKWLNDPPQNWPVFPTLHRPTITTAVKENLSDRGWDELEIDKARNKYINDFSLALSEGIPIPSITTHGSRRLLKRLTKEANIEVNAGDYLLPHGARRGIGEMMIRAYDFTTAARYLDNSKEITREHYSHIEAELLAEKASQAIEAEQVRNNRTDNENTQLQE